VVPIGEIGHGGHTSGVVKIDTKFHGGRSYSGTGFLINNGRAIATSGHLLFNVEEGHAKSAVIRAGPNGSSSNVECRVGIYAVIGHGWYASQSKPNDLGLIYLREPFHSVTSMHVRQTPASDNGTVYGYPGDMPHYAEGQELCKSASVITYNSDVTAGMVEHEADTEKGNSGGPVVDDHGLVIAIHRGWGYKSNGEKINHAVAIDHEGNDIAAFVAVLDYMAKRSRERLDSDGQGFGDVDFMAKNEGNNIKVEMIGEAKEVEGHVFTW